MRRLTLILVIGLLAVPLAAAVVPTSSLQTALTSVNGTADQSGQFDNRQKTYNTRVRDNFLDVQAQLDALEARIDALENPGPPPATGTTLLEPAEGATVSGIVTVRWRAVDAAEWGAIYSCGGHASVEDLSQDASGEFSVQWDTAADPINCTNGVQFLDAWAFDSAGSPVGSPPNDGYTITLNNAPPPPPPPPGTCDGPLPGPLAGLGYTQRFGDCFDTLDRTTWCDSQWYEPQQPPLGSQTVTAGELHLKRARATDYQNTTMSTEPCGQANPKSFQYGYFEARMRWDTVRGNGPAFWIFSTAHAENGDGVPPDNWPAPACAQPTCLSAELDIVEGFGNISYGGSRTDDFFSGTLHRNSCGCYGTGNQSRFVQRGTGLEMEEYHVYGALWTPTAISFYIDGALQGTVSPFDSTAQQMHLLLYNWNTDWEDENMPNTSTPDTVDTVVDWVRVWQQ